MTATAATGSSSSSSSSAQEYVVRVPSKIDKKYNVMKFNASLNVDFTKWTQSNVKMERENNLKDFKADDDMPKFGAGSEYGRDVREEARKKKYGIVSKRYKPDDQPWVMRLGSGKTGKRFRGIREGGVTENASYFVFTQAQDGAFEAFPVDEWYNYTPVQTYKTLNDDEAEEEFGRRDKVFNYFNIMLKKRLKNDDGGAGVGSGLNTADAEEMKNRKWDSKRKSKGHSELKISDADDWINSSDDDDDDDDDENGGGKATNDDKASKDKAKQQQRKNKNKKKGNKKKKGSDDDDDDEAIEDSDDGDGEGREVDYISDGTSSESDGAGGAADSKKDKNELKGVEDEEAIRKMENSESEDEENAAAADANNKETGVEDNKDAPGTKPDKASTLFPAPTTSAAKDKKEGSSSESSADSSDSDDFDNDTSFQSAMFMQDRQKGSKKGQKKGKAREAAAAAAAAAGTTAGPSSSRSNTPTMAIDKAGGFKRLADGDSKEASLAKKPRTDPFTSSEGISEESIRRYLVRKPMTARELLQKFKSKKTGLSSDQMVNTITQILKRLNPDKQHVKGKMYLSIKPKSQ